MPKAKFVTACSLPGFPTCFDPAIRQALRGAWVTAEHELRAGGLKDFKVVRVLIEEIDAYTYYDPQDPDASDPAGHFVVEIEGVTQEEIDKVWI